MMKKYKIEEEEAKQLIKQCHLNSRKSKWKLAISRTFKQEGERIVLNKGSTLHKKMKMTNLWLKMK